MDDILQAVLFPNFLCLSCYKYCTDNEEKATHVRFLLSNAEAGAIIGKGGSTINEIKSQSGVRIQLSRNNECFPGTSDRIIMLSGGVDGILTATELILSRLIDEVSDIDALKRNFQFNCQTVSK